ncbi:MAG: hypothetical protein JW763_04340 [candidate division Zixibacteria bacterium]|nr:hypothetical protein [candidate division Zixibacteria bacterium]
MTKRFSAMAMVVGGAERAMACLERKDNTAEIRLALKNLRDAIDQMSDGVVRNCRGLFTKKTSVMTYSNSGLVRKIVSRYAKKIRRLYVSEARPAGEGREVADYCADLGIPVTYCTDALLPSFLTETDLLLVGADSIGQEGFINKIGTAALLRLACDTGCTRAVVFESLKIRPDESPAELIREYPRTELWMGRARAKVTVCNPYFETVALNLADRFISDRGVVTSRELINAMKKTGR